MPPARRDLQLRALQRQASGRCKPKPKPKPPSAPPPPRKRLEDLPAELLARIAAQNPTAQFFSLDLVRNGKAAGERMAKFFKARNVTAMPYVEVYVGSTLVEAAVEPTLTGELCFFSPSSSGCASPPAEGGELRALHRLDVRC